MLDIQSLKAAARNAAEGVLAKAINELTNAEADYLLHDWTLWARPEQLEPPGDWQYHLILAGRAWGKTATGSQWVRQQVKTLSEVNLIGATSDDAVRVMVEGPSGILRSCSKADRPRFIANKNCMYWPNGAKSHVFTADRPDRLRGANHEALWMDELCSWRYTDSFDQAMFGLRIGKNPRALITTTPRPTKLIRDLIKDPATYVTRGTSYDNRANLAPSYFAKIIKKYEGTRLGRQELNGELLEDNPNALWHRDQLDALRILKPVHLIEFRRIVVAVDPAVTNSETSDETGIVVVGMGYDDHGYVIDDLSLSASPEVWARTAVNAYIKYQADVIVGETNNGGDLVEAVIRTINKNVNYKKIHASRGKAKRAEPVSSLYEQGRIHHLGTFSKLEDEMCEFDPTMGSGESQKDDRMDALVWGITELFSSDGLVF